MIFAAPGWALRLAPTLHALPQRDRGDGWLHDLLARYASNASFALAAAICVGLRVAVLRTPETG